MLFLFILDALIFKSRSCFSTSCRLAYETAGRSAGRATGQGRRRFFAYHPLHKSQPVGFKPILSAFFKSVAVDSTPSISSLDARQREGRNTRRWEYNLTPSRLPKREPGRRKIVRPPCFYVLFYVNLENELRATYVNMQNG